MRRASTAAPSARSRCARSSGPSFGTSARRGDERMDRFVRRALVFLVGAALFACMGCGDDDDGDPTCPSCTNTIIVLPDGSGDAPTIQAAIDAVDSLGTILLGDGVFRGAGNHSLVLGGKAPTIRSQSGSAAMCTIDCGGPEEEMRWGIAFRAGEDGAILSKLTIRGASIGAVLCERVSVNILGCHFRENEATLGGAISCTDGGVTAIRDCRFEANEAQGGGAIWCQYADPWITNCRFDGNVAAAVGGAIAGQSASPMIRTCDFFENRAGEAGGALQFLYGSPVLHDLLIEANRAGALGGGILVEDAVAPRIESCLIVGNEAASSAGLHAAGPCSIRRCTIAWNEAAEAGGGCGFSGPVSVSECTIAGNLAVEGGGIVVGGDATIDLTRTIIAFSRTGAAIRIFGAGTISIACCDLFGNDGGDWTGPIADLLGTDGNLSADPLFCDGTPASFALRADSPCLGAPCGRIGAWEQGCLPGPNAADAPALTTGILAN
ncbi:MAG: hypothetical protein GF346_00575 [Candidatus Eisenbacteria bacterium]|nr:hypothetical protein [Candidatus Latescibacterota bacterium]MBD3300925.1 hypothetical protein [Candidatus Eisenbacteria bacterium]